MINLAAGMWAIALLITLIGGIPYAIWTIYFAFKRKWKRVAYLIAAPIIFFAVLYAVMQILNAKVLAERMRMRFDTEVRLGKPIYDYDSPRSFHGDGYSFTAYELPESIRQRFESADQKLLTEFPKLPSYRKGWSLQYWKEAPLSPAFSQYLDFALSHYDENYDPGLSPYFKAIREALSHKSTYYSFLSNGHGERPNDIDLFIVDLENGRLYMINHNT